MALKLGQISSRIKKTIIDPSHILCDAICAPLCNCVCGLGFYRSLTLSGVEEGRSYLGAEKKQRVLSNRLVGDNLEVELTPLSFAASGGGEEIRGAPHAFTPSLTQKVHQLLEENEQ